ncbi:MAG: hypothetical protein AAFR71_05515 [Pseudomonadota bacterium]
MGIASFYGAPTSQVALDDMEPKATRQQLLPLALLIVFQNIDIADRVATGQIEPLRITSNAVITLGATSAIYVPTWAG